MKYLRFILGFGLAAILIAWVVKSGGADLREEWRHCDSGSLVFAFSLIGIGIALSSYRWARLLGVQGIHLSGFDAVRLTMIGVFFNVAVPGGVGGDLVKIVYLKRDAGSRFTEAIMTTLFDRILGLLGLFLVALIALAYNWSFVTRGPKEIQMTVSFVGAVSLVGAFGVAGALNYEALLRLPGANALKQKAQSWNHPKVWHIFRRIVGSIALFRAHLAEVFIALAVSMLIHTLTATSLWAIGQSFHAPVLQMRDYVLASTVANTVAAVPIMPGGLGGRDIVLKMFFGAAGESPGKSSIVPLVGSIFLVLWSLIGSVFFFFERRHLKELPPAELESLEQDDPLALDSEGRGAPLENELQPL